MVFTTVAEAKRLTGLSYIGMVNNSSKHEKAYHYNEMVYTIYLAPAKSSGYEVCPGRTIECTDACLNQSGRNIMDAGREVINGSRIKKTKLFFEEREFFVRWVIAEIESARAKAARLGYRFSVRLNNTSDISPEEFYINEHYNEGYSIKSLMSRKINLLQLFPDVQFYDYSKVLERLQLTIKYPNYDLTFSYTGYNDGICRQLLVESVCRVAVVFMELPETFWGYPVITGNDYDMRYLDPVQVIIGLPYKKVRNKLVPNNKFVIQ